jgi:uncharacterized coiled-coil protein SlyX
MAETAPKTRLEQFEENKAASEATSATQERESWENNVYGTAGVDDFTDEALKRVEEGDAYEQHMKAMAERSEESDNEAMNRNFDQDTESSQQKEEQERREIGIAEDEALREKFAGNAKLRQMEMMTTDIERLKAEITDLSVEKADPDSPEKQLTALAQKERQLRDKEDRLNDLLVKYSESPDYDEAIERFLIDPKDADALAEAAAHALQERGDREVPKNKAEEDETDEAARAAEFERELGPEPTAPVEATPESKANSPTKEEVQARLEAIGRMLEESDAEKAVDDRFAAIEQRLAERDAQIEKMLEQNAQAMERMAAMQEQMQKMFEAMQASGIAQAERNDNPAPIDDDRIIIRRPENLDATRKLKKVKVKNGKEKMTALFASVGDFITFRGPVWDKIKSPKARRQAKLGGTGIYFNAADQANRTRRVASARTQRSVDSWYANPDNQ